MTTRHLDGFDPDPTNTPANIEVKVKLEEKISGQARVAFDQFADSIGSPHGAEEWLPLDSSLIPERIILVRDIGTDPIVIPFSRIELHADKEDLSHAITVFDRQADDSIEIKFYLEKWDEDQEQYDDEEDDGDNSIDLTFLKIEMLAHLSRALEGAHPVTNG